MSVYDKAYELAEAVVNSQEYKEYLTIKEELQNDGVNFLLLEDFKRQQWEMQIAEILGHEIEDGIKELEETYNLLSEIPIINEFLTAEYRLSKMMAEVQKIVGEAVGLWSIGEDPAKWMN